MGGFCKSMSHNASPFLLVKSTSPLGKPVVEVFYGMSSDTAMKVRQDDMCWLPIPSDSYNDFHRHFWLPSLGRPSFWINYTCPDCPDSPDIFRLHDYISGFNEPERLFD